MFHHDSKTVSVERSNLSEAWRFSHGSTGCVTRTTRRLEWLNASNAGRFSEWEIGGGDF